MGELTALIQMLELASASTPVLGPPVSDSLEALCKDKLLCLRPVEVALQEQVEASLVLGKPAQSSSIK